MSDASTVPRLGAHGPSSLARAEFDLPSTGPAPIPGDTALAAVLGYARGRRSLRFRSPSHPEGRWVDVLAFAYERFDRRPAAGDLLGEPDILIAEGLHERLDPAGWAALRGALDDVGPMADAAVQRAAGRSFWDLPDDEFSVLAEPGTVGGTLRQVWQHCSGSPDVSPPHVMAALHHRRPGLFPLLDRTTRRQLFPHVREEDSGVEAVVHRELRANAAVFRELENIVASLLTGSTPLTRLRLHDVLLWLSGSLRLAHAVQHGRATAEWQAYLSDGGVHPGSRPV